MIARLLLQVGDREPVPVRDFEPVLSEGGRWIMPAANLGTGNLINAALQTELREAAERGNG